MNRKDNELRIKDETEICGERIHRTNENKRIKQDGVLWLMTAKIGFLGFMSFLSAAIGVLLLHMTILLVHWRSESYHFQDPQELLSSVYHYYKDQIYLFYMSIRHADCHVDGKMQVILDNYRAS